jgi:glycosyltransferase involved in cell wall biosynthesis
VGATGPSISIVIAAYNEEATVAAVFARSVAVLEQLTDDFEIVLVDDGSTDRTPAITEMLATRHPSFVRLIRHDHNQGIAATFEEAFCAGTREYIFDVPGDGEYPPEALAQILPLLDRYDIIVCNRTFKNYTLYRHLVSTLYRHLPRLLFGVDLIDPGSAKCRHRDVVHRIAPKSRGVFVEAERMIRAVRRGYRYGAVDITPEKRMGGTPRGARPGTVLAAAWDLAVLWKDLVLLRRSP